MLLVEAHGRGSTYIIEFTLKSFLAESQNIVESLHVYFLMHEHVLFGLDLIFLIDLDVVVLNEEEGKVLHVH